MEPVIPENKEKENNFEFYNYWKNLSTMGFQLFSINPIDVFVGHNAVGFVILNFEFRLYFKRS